MIEDAHLKVVAESNKYIDDDTPVGEFLFKLMIQNAIIKTKATYTHLRENLTNLDTYMSTVNSDIENFNNDVKVNVDRLKERGERTDDLIIKLYPQTEN